MNARNFVTPIGNEGIYILDTAAWRTERPVMDKDKCVECGLCMAFCPVNSIGRKEAAHFIDYNYCKGCGVCATECPKKAIDMKPEGGEQ